MPRTAQARSSWATFILLFALLLTWTMAIARYGGPDEPAHVLRAASVASGEIIGTPTPDLAPGFRLVSVPAALATGDPACFRHRGSFTAACTFFDPAAGTARVGSSAGTYPPLYYAMVGLPVRLLGQSADVAWYRIIAALWCAVVLACAARRARRLPGGALAIAALPPAAWFLFGVVNPNSLEIALAALAWVGVAALVRLAAPPPTMADIAWFSVPAAIFIAVRPISVVTWLVMLTVVVVYRKVHRWLLVGPPMAATVLAAGWAVASRTDVRDARTASSLGLVDALQRSVAGTTDTVRELAGSLGWLEFSAPTAASLLWFLGVAVVLVAAWRAATVTRWWAIGLVAVATVVAPVLFEVALRERVGFIWQGRYSIPMAMGVVVLGCASWHPRRWLTNTTIALAAAVELLTFWSTLRRYTVGVDGSWVFAGRTWEPAVSPWLLLALHLLVLGGLVVSSGNFSAHDVERRTGAEPLDLLVAEGVHALEVDR